MKMKGTEIVIHTLISHGVDALFGYPGGTVIDFYEALYHHTDEITHYITCHEQHACHAADGYARASGKVGVVLATSGPGATNLVTGLATAYLDSTPMVAITGNVPNSLIGRDSFQEVDIAGVTMPITKHNYIVKRIEELEDTLCEAFMIARSGRPGPVLVDIPKDVQLAQASFKGGKSWPIKAAQEPDAHTIEKAAEIIGRGEKPYIYVGGGANASGAYAQIKAFAERIDAPVGSSMMGLTAYDQTDARALGMTGMHGKYASSKARAASDLIVGIGVRFSDRATGNMAKYQENTEIIHIDIDAAELGKNVQHYTGVVGDVKGVLTALTAVVPQLRNDAWRKEVAGYKVQAEEMEARWRAERTAMTYKDVIHQVASLADMDTVVATDVGQHQMWTAQYYPFQAPRTLLTSGGLGTMGFGMGAAIGGCIARGKQKTILFTGDGSFHMNLNEMASAVKHNLPLIVVVLDNKVLGMVRQWQDLFFEGRHSQTTLERATDYVLLAESFGAQGFKATTHTELAEALEEAFAVTGPVIVHCPIDREEKVLPMIPPNCSVDEIILK